MADCPVFIVVFLRSSHNIAHNRILRSRLQFGQIYFPLLGYAYFLKNFFSIDSAYGYDGIFSFFPHCLCFPGKRNAVVHTAKYTSLRNLCRTVCDRNRMFINGFDFRIFRKDKNAVFKRICIVLRTVFIPRKNFLRRRQHGCLFLLRYRLFRKKISV